jgi:hypothetical protein
MRWYAYSWNRGTVETIGKHSLDEGAFSLRWTFPSFHPMVRHLIV